MLYKELADKKTEDLKELLLKYKKELFNLRIQKANSQLKDTSQFKKVRRSVARIRTVLGQERK